MDIIQRNFFRLLRSGVLNEYESLEPMSNFKWNRLFQIIKVQGVEDIALKGIKNHTYDENANIPKPLVDTLLDVEVEPADQSLPQMCNSILRKRLKKIQSEERHHIDASMTTLDLLNIIVKNTESILNSGISLKYISEIGSFANKGRQGRFREVRQLAVFTSYPTNGTTRRKYIDFRFWF